MLRRYFGNMRRDAGWPLEMISEAYGHKHIDTTIKYLNLVDDQLMEASDQYYAKHSALYDVEKLMYMKIRKSGKHWNKKSVSRWMPVQR